jgi:tight adherence protein B
MTNLLTGLGVLLVLLTIVYIGRQLRIRHLTRSRLTSPLLAIEVEPEAPPAEARPFSRRHWILPWVLALCVGAAVYGLAGWNLLFASTLMVLIGLLATQLDAYLSGRKALLIEAQLGDAIDLMVGALRAGASVLNGMENAVQESKTPLQPQLAEVLGRIRYGEDPQQVFRALAKRVPLETFHLFASALSVHWEVGGSLAPILASVGRAVRDRVEISRRIRSFTAQSRVSLVAVLLVTYFIGLVIWRNDPERMRQFLSTSVGASMIAIAVVFQAIGIVWSSTLSRMKY